MAESGAVRAWLPFMVGAVLGFVFGGLVALGSMPSLMDCEYRNNIHRCIWVAIPGTPDGRPLPQENDR